MQFIQKIAQRYRGWWEKIYLARHGCKTWREYHRRYDPDYNIRATRIRDIYHGYPYVYCFENHKHEVYCWDLAYDGSYIVAIWCEVNLCDKFRLDLHRAFKASSTSNEWEVNELGGGDYIFAAFKNETDYLIFRLRWS